STSGFQLLVAILHLTFFVVIYCLTLIFNSFETSLHYTLIVKQVPTTVNISFTFSHCTTKFIKIIFITIDVLPTILHLCITWCIVNYLILILDFLESCQVLTSIVIY